MNGDERADAIEKMGPANAARVDALVNDEVASLERGGKVNLGEAYDRAIEKVLDDPVEPIPEETDEPVDVEVEWESDEFGIKINATLGEAAIVVEHSWDGAEEAATLVNTLPQILIRVEEALQAANQEEQ